MPREPNKFRTYTAGGDDRTWIPRLAIDGPCEAGVVFLPAGAKEFTIEVNRLEAAGRYATETWDYHIAETYPAVENMTGFADLSAFIEVRALALIYIQHDWPTWRIDRRKWDTVGPLADYLEDNGDELTAAAMRFLMSHEITAFGVRTPKANVNRDHRDPRVNSDPTIAALAALAAGNYFPD